MKWGFPLPVCAKVSASGMPGTYTSPSGSTHIDCALVSGSLPILRQDVVETGAQHLAVWLDLLTASVQSDYAEVPRAVQHGPYHDLPPPARKSQHLLSSDLAIDSAWDVFLDSMHEFLSSRSEKPPVKRPGNPLFGRTQKSTRLTDKGGESSLAIVASRFARRLRRARGYFRHPSPTLLRKLQIDQQACELLHSTSAAACNCSNSRASKGACKAVYARTCDKES